MDALELVRGLLHDLPLGHCLADVALPDLDHVNEIEVAHAAGVDGRCGHASSSRGSGGGSGGGSTGGVAQDCKQ